MNRPCSESVIIDPRGHRARIPSGGVRSRGLSFVDKRSHASSEQVIDSQDDMRIDRNLVTDLRRRVEGIRIILKEYEPFREREGRYGVHLEREERCRMSDRTGSP